MASDPCPPRFPVHDLGTSVSQRPETLGTKEKFWLIPADDTGLPSRPHLFKIGRPNTGENWAERVACEIAREVKLPCAKYHLAVLGENRGVISERFLPGAGRLWLGNTLLASFLDEYDGSLRYRQVEYRTASAFKVLRRLSGLEPPVAATDDEDARELSASDFFAGFLVFDALIGNTDRHHENWGVVTLSKGDDLQVNLAPTFDHASSLGRDETDEKRRFRLATRDERATVEAYASRARTAFFGPGAAPKTLTSSELLRELSRSQPRAVRFWSDRILGLSPDFFRTVFARLDRSWISEEAVEFALRLLAFNQRMIREVVSD